MKKISVIVPIYNAQKYLIQCINSILNQTYKNLEILLINDGSSDDSLEICQKFEKKDKRIQVFTQENGGSTKARQTGLQVATGEYISFVDSDDWIDPCFYEKLYILAEINRADMVVSGCVVEDGKKSEFQKNNLTEGFYDKYALKKNFYPQMLYFESSDFFRFGIHQYLWNKLYKKSLIESCILKLDERIYDGEDVACVFEACLRADSIIVDNHCWYHYRIHENSICTSKKDERYFVNAVYLFQYMEKSFREFEEYKVMFPQLMRFINMIINNGTQAIFGYSYRKANFKLMWNYLNVAGIKKYKVALFGAGNVGRAYYQQLLQRDNVILSVWVDSHIYGNRIEGVLIEEPEALLRNIWDYVLVAVKDREKNKEIVEWLKKQDIKVEKIWDKEPYKDSYSYEFCIDKNAEDY